MITIAVLAIILAIGVPAMQGFIASARVRTTAQDLYSALQTARLEAIRRGSRVTICKANATLDNCSSNGQWNGGWLVFVDRTPGSTPAVDSTDTILMTQPPTPAGIMVLGNGGASGTANYASFAPDGTSRQLNGAFLAGTLRVCSTSTALTDANRARDVTINAVGRVATQTPANIGPTCPAPT
jgi:type IV fimbrial biogenesis protein FimT